MNFYSSNFVGWDILNGSPCTQYCLKELVVTKYVKTKYLKMEMLCNVKVFCKNTKNWIDGLCIVHDLLR